MKGLFHKRVPSFSFTSFNWNKDNHDPNVHPEVQSQPSTPFRSQFDIGPHSNPPSPPRPTAPLSLSPVQPPSPSRSITLVVCPDDPTQLQISDPRNKPQHALGRRSRANSLVDSIPEEGILTKPAQARGRRGSVNDARSDNNPNLLIESSRYGRSSSTHNFNRQRKRFSSFFSGQQRSTSASRSPSPGPASSRLRSASSERLHMYESDGESIADITPGNAFDQDSPSDEDSSESVDSTDLDDEDDDTLDHASHQTILANTTANASLITPSAYLQQSHQPVPFIDQAPNLTVPPPAPISFASPDARRKKTTGTQTNVERKASLMSKSTSLRRKKSNHAPGAHLPLPHTVTRPIYEKNRCTINIEQGNWAEEVDKAERTRFYLVACDMSAESMYAIEWCIGTLLRNFDQCLIISIIETETKFDPEDGGSSSDRLAKIKNQKDRQEKAVLLVREATSLLQRTKLHVKVTCQAVHAKNSRHMLIDCIDFLKPNLVIVGSRGLTSLKGTLMGSVSHYLVQKSSVPVMVARRKLRVLPKVYKKTSELDRNPRMRLDQAAIDKETPNLLIADEPAPEPVSAEGALVRSSDQPPESEDRSQEQQQEEIWSVARASTATDTAESYGKSFRSEDSDTDLHSTPTITDAVVTDHEAMSEMTQALATVSVS